jgi:hypothetical protein
LQTIGEFFEIRDHVCVSYHLHAHEIDNQQSFPWFVTELAGGRGLAMNFNLKLRLASIKKLLLASPPPRVTMLSRTFLQRIPRSATSISRLASSHVAAAATSPQPEMFCFQV